MNQKADSYKGYRVLILIAYLCMIILGILVTLKGTIIPSIRGEFGVDYTQIGVMLFAGSLGHMSATFMGGMLVEKYGVKKLFIFGVSIVTISSVLFAIIPNFISVVLVQFLLGIGIGSFEIGVNTLGAQIFVKNSATMMSLMHLFFGVGAMIAPTYAGAFIARGYSWQLIYLASIILIIIFLGLIMVTKFPETAGEAVEDKMSFKELTTSSKVWLIALTLAFFGLIEGGIADWLVNYLQEARALDVVKSTGYLTGFYITYTFGRLVGGFIADKVGYIKSLFYFTMMASLVILGGVLLGDKFIILFSFVGFFISIAFPTTMALIMKEYKGGVGAVMGFAITVNRIFNMIGNWLIGSINDLWSVSAGMLSLCVFGLVACTLLIILSRQLEQV